MLEFYKESNLIFGIIMSYYVWQNKEILMTLQKYWSDKRNGNYRIFDSTYYIHNNHLYPDIIFCRY